MIKNNFLNYSTFKCLFKYYLFLIVNVLFLIVQKYELITNFYENFFFVLMTLEGFKNISFVDKNIVLYDKNFLLKKKIFMMN